MARTRQLVIGVDVGTGSARAAVYDLSGKCHGHGESPLRLWRPAEDFVEQSSEDIWSACGKAVRAAMKASGARPERIAGIAFDATCSLVCVDERGRPVTVSPGGRAEQNVIVWMDHRAVDQARRINGTKHKVLRYVGGGVSPEMQTPKLLWLKERLSKSYLAAARFFDLADYLTWRATGEDVRSLCTTVCKWTYQGHLGGRRNGSGSVGQWDAGFLRQIGLGDLVEDGFVRIGQRVRPMGEPVGKGLTPTAAKELGLSAGTAVGVGIIDAHAGGIGVLGAELDGESFDERSCLNRLALIGGTSSCHMAVSAKARYVAGVWGPYYSAMIPGYWLTEGGQSATGALIDQCVMSRAVGVRLAAEAKKRGRTVFEALNDRLAAMAGPEGIGRLTRRLHVLGDHHGNRSPRANPLARGMISGLTLRDDEDGLALEYLATIQAVAYGTRHIIETLNAKGYAIQRLAACGGGTKNPVFLQQHADITGCPIHLPREAEAVTLGTAVLAAVAAGAFADIPAGMKAMTGVARTIRPEVGAGDFHGQKYRVFQQMYADQVRYDRLMGAASSSDGRRRRA